MKILLTGGAGFIATHTCVELMEAGHEAVIVDNYVNSQPEAVRRVEEIVGRPVKVYEADVCDKDAMNRIFDENEFDAVIHFAKQRAAPYSVKSGWHKRYTVSNNLNLCCLSLCTTGWLMNHDFSVRKGKSLSFLSTGKQECAHAGCHTDTYC